MSRIGREAALALRNLGQRPGFAAVVVASLALGIGATLAVWGVADQVLLHPLDVAAAERLVEAGLHWTREGEHDGLSHPAYQRYAKSGVLDGLEVHADLPVSLTLGDTVQPLNGQLVSPGFFRLLGVEMAQGRSFSEAEAAVPVVVVGWDLWQGTFGGRSDLVGDAVVLNDQPYTVVGIAPQGFRGLSLASPVDLWVPVENLPAIATGFMAQIPVLDLPGVRWLKAVGRLPAGLGTDVAADGLSRLAHRVEESQSRDVSRLRMELTPLHVAAVGRESRNEIQSFLLLLAILVGLELLATCSNLAGMFFAHGLQRRREAAVRFAVGAPTATFGIRLAVEGLALAALGGLLGFGLAAALMRWLGSLDLPALAALAGGGFELDPAGLPWALAAALILSLLLTLPVAWRLGRLNPAEAFKDTAPVSGTGGANLRRGLIVLQAALALIVLVGTGLFARSLQNAWTSDPGFDAGRVVATDLHLGLQGYDEARARNFYDEARARLLASPAVAEAAWSSGRPLGAGRIRMTLQIVGTERSAVEDPEVTTLVISPGFFSTLGVPLERGRPLTAADREGAPGAAVVSQAFASRHWPGRDAVGQRIRLPNVEQDLEIVGVARDFSLDNLSEEPQPILYLPLSQHFGLAGRERIHLLARAAGPPSQLPAILRDHLEELAPNVHLGDPVPLEWEIYDRFAPQQVGTVVLAILALFALLAVSSGIYGLLNTFVLQHTREIGLRVALGADPGEIFRLVAQRSLVPMFLGLVLGAVTAFLLLRIVASLLYGVLPSDLGSYLAASALLLLTAALASYLPARRAVRIPPNQALRYE